MRSFGYFHFLLLSSGYFRFFPIVAGRYKLFNLLIICLWFCLPVLVKNEIGKLLIIILPANGEAGRKDTKALRPLG